MSKKSNLKRLLASAAALIMACSAVPMTVFADTADTADSDTSASAENTASDSEQSGFVKQKTYSDYYDEIADKPRPEETVTAEFTDASDETECSVESYEGKENVLVWSNQEGAVTYEVDVPKAGAYNLEVTYFPITGGNTTTEMSVLLDGVSPYDTATRASFPRTWVNAYPIKTDSKDNEVRPPQVEQPEWTTISLRDVDGLFNDPLYFYFDEGKHTITFESYKASVAIAEVKLVNSKGFAEYTKPSDSDLAANSDAEVIRIEGEHADTKSDQTLYPTYDRGSYLTSPSNPTKQRYNTIGEGTWDSAGQSITWNVDVDKDGYYKLGIKARQNSMRGMYSNRRVYIDGEVPNDAYAQVKFYYDADWECVSPEDDNGDPAYVYLTKGKHTLTMEVIPGEIGDSMRRLDSVVYDVNQYYRKILMITGPNPDKYTDYNVDKEIPELISEFTRLRDALYEEKANIESLSNQGGSEAAALERLAIVLDRCIEKKNKIPQMISTLKDNVASVSSWMRQYRTQPLQIDYFELAPASKDFTSCKEQFFKSLSFSTKSFFGSFVEDYTVLSDVSQDSINVWVGLGRDQTVVVKELVDSQFVPEYNINVSINLVQGSIMEAVMAGKGPDVSLFCGGEFPINLAIRDLILPLDEMDGFDEIKDRFQDTAFVHYTFNDRVYGVPISRTFPMMFYRTDVLAGIGIDDPPETWDDLIDMLPAIQRAYLMPGLVLPVNVNGNAVAAATESGHTFALLTLQRGINYYNDDQTATTFETQEAVDAFEQWVKFYTTYNFDQQYDAFTRFRTGEAPIVIQNYNTFYNQLNVAAPEIKGLWDFTSVPGTLREDGTVSHAANSNGSGVVILKDCKNVDAAWEFIKWFTSSDVMVAYGQNVEGVMGPLGRFDSANPEALQRLNWSKKDLTKIMAQMDELEEIPITPSSYVVTRSIMNAFRTCVNDAENPRETLRWYNRDINAEITRKRENLGLDD